MGTKMQKTTLKRLWQTALAANVLTDLYVAPADTIAHAYSLTFCNRGNAAAKLRLAVSVGGAIDDVDHLH